MNKKYLKKISDYTVVGGLGAVLVAGLAGCNDGSQNQNQGQNSSAFTNASQKEGAFVIIEKRADGGYTIADEFPASKTTIVLREADGSERILTQAEIDALVAEEDRKIDNGTSRLTNPDQAGMSSGGMGLGEVLLSSIAGAMIGSYIGNKLFNNQNYQSQRRTNYKSPSTFSRSVDSFNKAKTSSTSTKSTSSTKSGFFGSSSKSGSSSSSFFGSKSSGFGG